MDSRSVVLGRKLPLPEVVDLILRYEYELRVKQQQQRRQRQRRRLERKRRLSLLRTFR